MYVVAILFAFVLPFTCSNTTLNSFVRLANLFLCVVGYVLGKTLNYEATEELHNLHLYTIIIRL